MKYGITLLLIGIWTQGIPHIVPFQGPNIMLYSFSILFCTFLLFTSTKKTLGNK